MLYVGRAFVWSEKCPSKNTPIYSKDIENIFKKVGSSCIHSIKRLFQWVCFHENSNLQSLNCIIPSDQKTKSNHLTRNSISKKKWRKNITLAFLLKRNLTFLRMVFFIYEKQQIETYPPHMTLRIVKSKKYVNV